MRNVSKLTLKNVHLNVAGATPKKVRELEVIGDYSPDIICLCEHWLTSSAINVLNVTNYKLISSYCRIVNKHGGNCILSKNSIAKTIQFNKWKEKYFECAISTVELSGKNKLIIVVYRTPD